MTLCCMLNVDQGRCGLPEDPDPEQEFHHAESLIRLTWNNSGATPEWRCENSYRLQAGGAGGRRNGSGDMRRYMFCWRTFTTGRAIMITSRERIITESGRTASLAAEPVRFLLRQLLGDLSTLCRQEIALAKADLSGSLCAARRSIVVLMAGGVVIFGGFLALLSAAILGLGTVMQMWLAALLVGIAVAILGGVLLKVGQSGVGTVKLTPMQSKESLRRDKAVLVRSAT
jgi:hypothetical protein